MGVKGGLDVARGEENDHERKMVEQGPSGLRGGGGCHDLGQEGGELLITLKLEGGRNEGGSTSLFIWYIPGEVS